MQNFRNVKAWQRAHGLALTTYRITADFPKDELFGMRLSMRRTAVDIPAAIAEGCGKDDDLDFARCLSAAVALANKLEYYALMARDLELISHESHHPYEAEIIEVSKMIGGFKRTLNSSNSQAAYPKTR